MNRKSEYIDGFRKGIPIGLGYLPVSFTFGVMAVAGGIPVLLTVFTSVSNLTSAGQFAGAKLIFASAGYFEIALTTFVINIGYMLMSLALSQRLEEKTSVWQRLLIGYGVTDEVFAIASVEKKRLTAQLRMQSVRSCVWKDTMIVFTNSRNEPHAIYVSHSLLSGRHR